MAVPSSFAESNLVLDAPAGLAAEVGALAVWRGVSDDFPLVVSCWKLTQAELDEVNRTGRIWLLVQGQTMPPAEIVGENPFQG